MLRNSTLTLCLVLLVGCGQHDPELKEVSGMVTYRGTPLAPGKIEFSTEEGTQAFAAIHDGKYTVAAVAGLEPGHYRVSIVSMHLRSHSDEPPQPGGVRAAAMAEGRRHSGQIQQTDGVNRGHRRRTTANEKFRFGLTA